MGTMCAFYSGGGYCSATIITTCDGKNTECKFYKTKEQKINDEDRAIEINRIKGNCNECPYTTSGKCKCSYEK